MTSVLDIHLVLQSNVQRKKLGTLTARNFARSRREANRYRLIYIIEPQQVVEAVHILPDAVHCKEQANADAKPFIPMVQDSLALQHLSPGMQTSPHKWKILDRTFGAGKIAAYVRSRHIAGRAAMQVWVMERGPFIHTCPGVQRVSLAEQIPVIDELDPREEYQRV